MREIRMSGSSWRGVETRSRNKRQAGQTAIKSTSVCPNKKCSKAPRLDPTEIGILEKIGSGERWHSKAKARYTIMRETLL